LRKPLLLRVGIGFFLCLGVAVAAQNVATFKIPPVKIPLQIKGQAIAITASGLVTVHATDQDASSFRLELTADLSELQQNLTALLSAQLGKNEDCGERIAIQQAELVPADPASVATVQLHYERWACAKVFGKEKSKKLVNGNAVIEMKLTPAVEEDNTELRLVPEVGKIEADGSLGELLRSGSLGDMLKEKIRTSILSAMQKGTNLSVTIPAAIQGHVKIGKAEFKDAGGGKLAVLLVGEGRISKEEMQMLSRQVKERIAAK
jgi:hypothetical protein